MSSNAQNRSADPTARLSLSACLVLAWLAACALTVTIHWSAITQFRTSDPDDALRLVQVRDWLAGQSWFDVSQHRFDPPRGGDMHWSRIVDLPIAGAILLLTPLMGTLGAETMALTLIPLLLLGVTTVALGHAVQPLAGRSAAIVAALIVPLMPSLLYQFGPMRIDHHGWQITMSSLCLAALLAGRGWRPASGAGLICAAWVHVSAEAVPYVAAVGGLVGIRYLLCEAERRPLLAYFASLSGAALLFFVLTRSAAEWFAPKCDALSSPFLAAFLLAALILAAGTHFACGRSLSSRAAVLACTGGAAGASFVLIGGNCLGGPFSTLHPIVYRFWYLQVLEGLPIWKQELPAAVGTLWTPAVGLIGTWLGWRSAPDVETARRWTTVALLLVAATGLAILVHRAEGIAHLYALPGCALVLLMLLRRVSNLGSAFLRVPLSTLAIIAPSPAPAMLTVIKIQQEPDAPGETVQKVECPSFGAFSGLAKLPAQRMLAPIDIGPALLASTPHKAVAGGYHRNNDAMRAVIETFLGDPDQARAMVSARGISLVVYCSHLSEVHRYTSSAPRGFMGRLQRGDVPNWLERVSVEGPRDLHVFQVKIPD